jgi:hypothetical protein
MPRITAAVTSIVLALAAGACGSDGSTDTAATTTTASAEVTATTAGGSAADYHPVIDPASFSSRIDNPYFPLTPGTTYVFEGTVDGSPQRNVVEVTTETKEIIGVTCVVVHDTVYVDGTLTEDTFDWYAQDADGNVWYFGEDSKEYLEDGTVDLAGSWEAGVDGAEPGIAMKADPKVGDAYRQELYIGEAEDFGKVLTVGGTVTVPTGTYNDVITTEDTTPLEPDQIEHKQYAPGVGLVVADMVAGGQEHIDLVEIRQA